MTQNKDPHYPGTTLVEITLPSPLQEVLEGVQQVELPKASPDEPASRWEEAMRLRKLKASAYWLSKGRKRYEEKKKKRKALAKKLKAKPAKIYAQNKKYQMDPWWKYSRLWKVNKIEMGFTKEEIRELWDSFGGMFNVEMVGIQGKKATKDTIVVLGYDDLILYRGIDVTDEKVHFVQRLAKQVRNGKLRSKQPPKRGRNKKPTKKGARRPRKALLKEPI